MACAKHYPVTQLDAGDGRSISIMAKRYYEQDQPVYYQVDVGKETVVPRTYMSSIDPDDVKHLHLRLVSNKDRSVIGVVEDRLPQKVWLLHNFSTGETWPRCQSGGMEQCERRGEALLKVLQTDHPEIVFIR